MLDPQREREIIEKIRAIPCVSALQLRPIEMWPGFVRVSAARDARFDGLAPGFHGGMLANVADCVAWFAIVTEIGPDTPMVTTDLQVRYLAPCLTDVTATARVIRIGRTLCPVAVELHDFDGKLVAVAQVCYMRLDGPVAPNGSPA